MDRDTEEGFDFHTTKDHFLWNYVYFIIHLNQKDPSDFNGTESYIATLLENEDLVWFPAHKSIRLINTLKQRKSAEATEEASELDLMQEEIKKCDEALTKIESQP